MAVKWNHAPVFNEIKKAVENAADEAGELVAQEARVRVETGPKTGRIYVRYDPYRIVQASAPGEAPATDTGNLANKILPEATTTSDKDIVKTISSKAPYSALLELGGVGASGSYTEKNPETMASEFKTSKNPYIAPRPFLRPSLIERRKEIVSILEGKLKK